MEQPIMKIVILEDNSDRRSEMERCLRDRFRHYESVFFDDAKLMRVFLETNLASTLVISLDHDLEPKSQHNGKPLDPGTGRQLADFLVQQPPACPIIIATTNSAAGDGMEFVLREAHWETHRVYPWGDLEWISSQWFRTVRNAIVATAKPREKSPN
jgi:CheY-like chemotaxis protein